MMKRAWLTRAYCLFFLWHPAAWTIDIGPLTAVLEPDKMFMARTITNNDSAPKVYEIKVEKISHPKAHGQPLAMTAGELLYTPKRFVLHGGQLQNIKFYYKGAEDELERYYRVTYIETPAARQERQSPRLQNSSLDLKVELQSILVVRPRQVKFNYELDENKGSIHNNGNTFFEFIVKLGCDEPDSMADTKYLLPGESWHNSKIAQSGNHKVIVYANRFLNIGQACLPPEKEG